MNVRNSRLLAECPVRLLVLGSPFLHVGLMSLALRCESCGMPMATNEEHGAQNPNNPYCIHCTDMKGKLLPFERKFEDMVKSAMDTRWMNREQAEKYVLSQMAELPAWRDRVAEMKPGASAV